MAKKNLAVIGGGVIVTHYMNALSDSEIYHFCALCDHNPECIARNVYSDVSFYEDYRQMVQEEKLDAVMIATPPETHFQIACNLLRMGVNVLVEKPMCADYQSVEELFGLAAQTGKDVACLFHWRYADEVLFLNEYLKDKKIKKIVTRICDNYCEAGTLHIKKECLGLLGAWFDSGVNVISYLDLLLDVESFQLISSEMINDHQSGLPVYVKKNYLCNETEIEIIIDWRLNTREKTSVIVLENEELFVSHMDQTVSLENKMIFQSPVEDRLASHYVNMLSDQSFKKDNEILTKRIHRILFEEK